MIFKKIKRAIRREILSELDRGIDILEAVDNCVYRAETILSNPKNRKNLGIVVIGLGAGLLVSGILDSRK